MAILYIDPGTGSMLFTVLLGLMTTLFFFVQKWGIRLKSLLRGGHEKIAVKEKLPFVIFSDDKRYWTTFCPICEVFEARGIPLVYWTCSEDDPALSAGYEHITAEYIGDINRAVRRLNVMNATVCLSTTPGLDVFQWKRSKSTDYYVHVFHSAWDATSYRMFGLDYYDAVIVNGQFKVEQLRKLEQLRHLPPKEIEVLGLPYLDALDARRRTSAENNTASGPASSAAEGTGALSADKTPQRTVLLAPSWGESAILSRFGGKILDALISTGYRIVVRPHPQSWTSDKGVMDHLLSKYPESDLLSWNRDNDNFDILQQSDIMISDFSGVTLDYSLVFDKPLIYAETAHDKSVLDASWLEEEMWIFETLPRIGLKLTEDMFDDMKQVIDKALTAPSLSEGRERARQEAWAHRGKSAELTADYLISTQERLAMALTPTGESV